MEGARTYKRGDRVMIRGTGVTGRVTDVVRRGTFAGYLIDIGLGEPQEIPAHCAVEPDRPLLREWRRWAEQDLALDYVAWLSDAQVEQLRTEYLEVSPGARTGPGARYLPRRVPGYKPLHLTTIAKTTERYEVTRSDGSRLRVRERHTWWVRCVCGFHRCRETAGEAKALQQKHETNGAGQ